jgi:hypothetical protein
MRITGNCKEIEIGDSAVGCLCMTRPEVGVRVAGWPTFDKLSPPFELAHRFGIPADLKKRRCLKTRVFNGTSLCAVPLSPSRNWTHPDAMLQSDQNGFPESLIAPHSNRAGRLRTVSHRDSRIQFAKKKPKPSDYIRLDHPTLEGAFLLVALPRLPCRHLGTSYEHDSICHLPQSRCECRTGGGGHRHHGWRSLAMRHSAHGTLNESRNQGARQTQSSAQRDHIAGGHFWNLARKKLPGSQNSAAPRRRRPPR